MICQYRIKVTGLSFAKFRSCPNEASQVRDGKHYCKRCAKRHDRKNERQQDRVRKDEKDRAWRRRMHDCVIACTGIEDPIREVEELKRKACQLERLLQVLVKTVKR